MRVDFFIYLFPEFKVNVTNINIGKSFTFFPLNMVGRANSAKSLHSPLSSQLAEWTTWSRSRYLTCHYRVYSLVALPLRHDACIKKIISFTLYPAHIRVGRGNLVLRLTVPHFPLSSRGVAYWGAELNAALCLDNRAKKWKYKCKQIFYLLEWGSNLQPVYFTVTLCAFAPRLASNLITFILSRSPDQKWH